MSPDNLQVVQRALTGFASGDPDWLEVIDPALEWYPIEDGHSVARGREGALAVRERWLESFDGVQSDLEGLQGDGEDVIASLHITGTGRASGIPVDLRVHMHWRVRDGRVFYIYEYADKGAALKAAGLTT